MGTKCDRWLARPSTLCFLRRLLLTTTYKTERLCCCEVGYRAHSIANRRSIASISSREGRRNNSNETKESTPSSKSAEKDGYALRGAPKVSASYLLSKSPRDLLSLSASTGKSFETLQRESDVASDRNVGTLLVDRPENHGDFQLWIELLQFRHRLHGLRGVMEVWQGMKKRRIDLPAVGEEADVLWSTFVHASISRDTSPVTQRLYDDIVAHAIDLKRRHGIQNPGLLKCILARFLRMQPDMARLAFKRLRIDLDAPYNLLSSLVADFAASPDSYQARKSFKRMYELCEENHLYDIYIPEILKLKDMKAAHQWHRELLSKGDGPSPELFPKSEIQFLFALDNEALLPTTQRKHNPNGSSSSVNAVQKEFLPLTRAKMSTIVGDVHGIKPKEISDTFVARIIATQSFSLDLVVKGVSFFGIEKLGPVALRELALRTKSCVAFRDKLVELKAVNVTPNNSVYSRLVQKIVDQNDTNLFAVLLGSDQHPDTYDDPTTQQLLLASFVDKKDWDSAHITLLGLSFAGDTQQSKGWNQILQYYIRTEEYRKVAQIVQHMQTAQLYITRRSLTFMHHYLLPKRRLGKRPYLPPRTESHFNLLDFTANVHMYAAERGTPVNPKLWTELLKRYGMMHEWYQLERLVLWLVSWSATNPQSSGLRDVALSSRRHRKARSYSNVDPEIFGPLMQQAIVTWGFMSASVRDQLQKLEPKKEDDKFSSTNETCEPWARGLALLKKLDGEGFKIRASAVRRSLLHRLWTLFGPGFSTKGLNNQAMARNRLSLAHYVSHANEIWNGKLFNIEASLLENDSINYPKLFVAVFGPVRRTSKRGHEYADVVGYAHSSSFPQTMAVRTSIRQKEHTWRINPFRLRKEYRHMDVDE